MNGKQPKDSLFVSDVLGIIAVETGVSREELVGEAAFADLGVDDLLSKCVRARICQKTGVELPTKIFEDYPTVDTFRKHLQQHQHLKATVEAPSPAHTTAAMKPPASTYIHNDPLSILLQGNARTSQRTLFLLPDGSGSGMAYVRLPTIHPSISLIALNSPFLCATSSRTFTVESISRTWAVEICRRQPKGPYIIGGWSAGGYYAYEVAKHLMRLGEVVEKIILIDSPCRLEFEALPMEVVEYLSRNNLMGNWKASQTPEWLINHFDLSICAIENYIPTPMNLACRQPEVFIVWAEDGVLENGDAARDTNLNLDVKVTRFLIHQREGFGPHGWERLFPGSTLSIAKMPGNHFTLVHPPNCNILSVLLREALHNTPSGVKSNWQTMRMNLEDSLN